MWDENNLHLKVCTTFKNITSQGVLRIWNWSVLPTMQYGVLWIDFGTSFIPTHTYDFTKIISSIFLTWRCWRTGRVSTIGFGNRFRMPCWNSVRVCSFHFRINILKNTMIQSFLSFPRYCFNSRFDSTHFPWIPISLELLYGIF